MDFSVAFQGLNPKEKSEALQCLLKTLTVYEDRIVSEIFDLPEFKPGSQKRTAKLLKETRTSRLGLIRVPKPTVVGYVEPYSSDLGS